MNDHMFVVILFSGQNIRIGLYSSYIWAALTDDKGLMMTGSWNVTTEMSVAHRTQVFSGGACNILDSTGTLLRNTERDRINTWLSDKQVFFFDPQIHPDTHGVEYNYDIHHKVELAARAAAKINLYEVSPRTFGGITSFEIAADQFRFREPMVIYYSDGDPEQDVIPEHSSKGYPLFAPHGIHATEQAMRAHYREFVKNGNNMRKYLATFAREMDTLTVTFSDKPHKGDIIITPERMHAADLFKAVVRASSGERVFVTFTGGDRARDQKGNAVFLVPNDPPEIEMEALLDQYVDEGNELRRSIAELVEISVFTRVVYTQTSAIQAMYELLMTKKILS